MAGLDGAMGPSALTPGQTAKAVEVMQGRLTALLDFALALKHAHWNLVGPGFIAVHELLDDQVEEVRSLADALAERIAAFGHVPNGLAGHIVATRQGQDYALGRAVVEAHVAALDVAYTRLIAGHREAEEATREVDVVTNGILLDQTAELEQLHWLLRAHVVNTSGAVPSARADDQLEAAAIAATSDPRD